jgi:outer membrane protein with beta-barrel domain
MFTAGSMRPGPRPFPGLLILCGLVTVVTPSYARERIPYAGGRFGYLRLNGVDTGSLNVGILGGMLFVPRVAVEASLDYHTADFDLYGRETYAFQTSVYVYPFSVRHAVLPYGVAGAGFYWNYYRPEDPSASIEDEHSDAGFHAGFGFDVRLGGRGGPTIQGTKTGPLRLTVDLRYLFTRPDPGATESDGLLATIGLKIGF